MALAVTIRFQIRDGKGKSSGTKVRVPTGFSIPQYIEFAQGMGQLIADMSSGLLTSVSIGFAIDLTGLSLKTTANVLADIAQKGYFAFTSAVTGFFKRLRIPTWNEELVNSGDDSIDVADAAVVAFITAMEDGIVVTGGTISPTTEREQDLVALSDAREVFRKKR